MIRYRGTCGTANPIIPISMIVSNQPKAVTSDYLGTDKLITGVVLAVITFWLFAQTTLNIAPAMSADLKSVTI